MPAPLTQYLHATDMMGTFLNYNTDQWKVEMHTGQPDNTWRWSGLLHIHILNSWCTLYRMKTGKKKQQQQQRKKHQDHMLKSYLTSQFIPSQVTLFSIWNEQCILINLTRLNHFETAHNFGHKEFIIPQVNAKMNTAFWLSICCFFSGCHD